MSVPVSFSSARISGNRASHEFHVLSSFLHSFLYFCWCCLSQSCCPCPFGVPVCDSGSCSEQVEVQRSSADVEGVFHISVVAGTGACVFHHKVLYSCHPFVNSVLEFCEGGAASPPPQASCIQLLWSSSGTVPRNWELLLKNSCFVTNSLVNLFCLPEEHPQWSSVFAFEISKEVTALDCGQDEK